MLAQEVLLVTPYAVFVAEDGFNRAKYDRLSTSSVDLGEWQKGSINPSSARESARSRQSARYRIENKGVDLLGL